jgi:hypothetical protein
MSRGLLRLLHEAGRIDLRQPGRSDSGLPLRDIALIAVLRERPTAGTSAKPCRIRSRRKARSAAQHRRGPRAKQRTQLPRVFRVFGLRVSGVLRVEEVHSPLQSRSGAARTMRWRGSRPETCFRDPRPPHIGSRRGSHAAAEARTRYRSPYRAPASCCVHRPIGRWATQRRVLLRFCVIRTRGAGGISR